MSSRSSRERKRIIRESDGSLYDQDERRPISIAELTDYLRDVGYFECRRARTGGDCTYEVLQEIYGLHGGGASVAIPSPLTPLGLLSALAGFNGEIASGVEQAVARPPGSLATKPVRRNGKTDTNHDAPAD